MVDTKVIGFDFSYYRPTELKDALLKLKSGDFKILAGGTDLVVRMKTNVEKPQGVIDINAIPELHLVNGNGNLEIGATVKLSEILQIPLVKEKYMGLYEGVASIGGWQIRNMATLAGNLCNASPGADSAPSLLTYGASIEIAYLTNNEELEKRVIPLDEFFKGPGITALKKDELVTKVVIPPVSENSGSAFKKIARVNLDIAKISCAVYLVRNGERIEDIRVAVGAAAATPVRAYKIEEALKGNKFNKENLKKLSKLIKDDISPITDIRSTEEYRREVAPVVAKDTIEMAWERAKGVVKR